MKNEYDQHKEMSDILKAELDREAREILAEIEADESLRGLKMPEGSEEDLLQRIRKLEEQKKAYEQLSDADKEALRIGREIQMQKEHKVDDEKVVPFKKKKKRVCLLVAAVAVLALGMGITSVGEVPLVTSIRESLFGEKELTHVNSARENSDKVKQSVEEEMEIYEEIKDTFGVKIVTLDYRPNGSEIYQYEIDELLNKAHLLYQWESKIIDYQMFFNYNSQAQGYLIDGTLLKDSVIEVGDISVVLREYQLLDGNASEYIAEFDYQDVHYILSVSSEVSEGEIKEILKNLKIF